MHRFLGLVGGLFEAGPGPNGEGNVVALAADKSALAGLHAGELLTFAVKLLNRPADAAFIFGSGRVARLGLVGHEVVHPVGGHQYAEAFQFAVPWHTLYFQDFALLHLFVRPIQVAHRLVGLLVAGIIDEAVAFQRAVKRFAGGQQPLEQGRGGVPAVHEHCAVVNVARGQLGEYASHVLELDLAVHVGGDEAVINQPKLVGVEVDVHEIDHADADNHAVGIAAVLAADLLDATTVVLVEHRIVEQDVVTGAERHLLPHLLPELTWREMTGI